jgi:hypothetical protein
MKFSFLFLLLLSIKTFAQIPPDNNMSIQDIALMESRGHQRLANRENATMASTNFDVKYYRCEWEVDPAIRYIKGTVTIYYLITSTTGSIDLDLMSPLITDSVKQRNLLLTKSQANNTLSINFPGTVNTGTFDSVSIYYQGVPPNTGFGSFIQSTHAGTPVMWSLSEPYGSRDWWPCKNGLDDKADSIDILVTNPIAYKAASNGLLQSETITAGNTKITAHWKHRYAIASYLICFAVTNYTVFNNTVTLSTGILPMQTYCYPESLSSFQNGTINTLNAMQQFDTTFGPYPFMNEKYGHVQFGWGGGMEHQTATFIVNIGESLCAHELGHQWFGDKITCGTWKDIWLNEGFATHLASMYMEKKYPANIISTRKSEISNITSQPGGSVEVDDTTSVNRIFDSRLSYTKGSHLLYMLRWIMGDNTFFTAIRNYQTDPAVIYGFARTADLKRNLEQTSGINLTNFFNKWYSGQGYPTYNVQWANTGTGDVWIKMNQVTSHASVSFFDLPVALQFRNATQSATVVVNNLVNGEIFIKPIGFVADTVLIDPEAWLITRNNTTSKLPSCGTVSGLTSSAVTTTTATVSWSALSGANNYNVDYKLASSGTWINAATATTSLSVNLSGLTVSSLYDWRVRANCTGPTGAYAQAQFTTSALPTCGAVTGLTSSAITTTTATVSWTALSGANNYDVDYKLASSGIWINAATATTSLSVNLTGLTASSLYDWRVRANCTGATGAYAQAQFTTATPTCGTVTGLISSAITSSTATVSWAALSGANNYDVGYKLTSSGTWIVAATATTSLSVNLTGLTSSSLYDWRVRANCTDATGAYAQAQFTTSTAITCPGPYDVSTNGTTNGAALVPLNTDIKGTISPVNDIDHYRFQITTGGTIILTLQTLPANYNLDLLNASGTRIGRSSKNGTNNETINATVAAGTYYAKVYPNGSANNATQCYTLKITLGTASRSMSLYPNPANQILNISLVSTEMEKIIEVFDLNGKLVMTEKVMQNNAELDISTLPGGLYLIKVTTKDGTLLSKDKFVKQ